MLLYCKIVGYVSIRVNAKNAGKLRDPLSVRTGADHLNQKRYPFYSICVSYAVLWV